MTAPVRDVTEIGRLAQCVFEEMRRSVVGKSDVVETVLVGLLAGGHVLLEDVPGTAKTSIVRGLSQVLGLAFSRIQFTPDLMPSDVTGSTLYDRRSGELSFSPGPIFANLVLGDEINRAPPKTQAALLEAMQEQQVTVDGVSHPLPSPFAVVATQNPVEYEGTYPLPEAQLDRFMLRTGVGYPNDDDEWEIVRRRAGRDHDDVGLDTVLEPGQLLEMRAVVEQVTIDEVIGRYLVSLVRSTRTQPGVEVGASPRAALALLQASCALAALRGRSFVIPDDPKSLAVACLSHRLGLRPDLWLRGTRPEDVVRQCIEKVPVPITS